MWTSVKHLLYVSSEKFKQLWCLFNVCPRIRYKYKQKNQNAIFLANAASGTTAAPIVSGGGFVTTFAPGHPVFPGSGTGTNTGSGSPTGNGNGCPPFDASCTPQCTAMDAMGCLTCSCSGLSSIYSSYVLVNNDYALLFACH